MQDNRLPDAAQSTLNAGCLLRRYRPRVDNILGRVQRDPVLCNQAVREMQGKDADQQRPRPRHVQKRVITNHGSSSGCACLKGDVQHVFSILAACRGGQHCCPVYAHLSSVALEHVH